MAYLQSSVYKTRGKESGVCSVAIGMVSEKGKYIHVIYDMMVCSPTLSSRLDQTPYWSRPRLDRSREGMCCNKWENVAIYCKTKLGVDRGRHFN